MIYMIGNAHLDPVWLWTKLEGFGEVVSTFESALRRIEEEDRFVFTCSSAAYYAYVKQHDPQMFERVRAAVKAGKWNIVGGYWIQPDDNIMNGELYARHALYSQRFYEEEFGITCKTGYTVDTFGHNGALPKLLRESGMENFLFMRPSAEEKPLPPVFYWNSADGSSVLTYRITGQNYNNFFPFAQDGLRIDIEKMTKLSEENGYDMMCFYGVGNHGGGPTRRQVIQLGKMIDEGSPIRFASVDEYFDDLRASKKDFPVYTGDLQHHAIGAYSVTDVLKVLERQAETELEKAEKWMLLSADKLGTPYENDKIRAAYENVMFNTFHDIICGCTVREGIENAVANYYEAISVANKIKEKAFVDIAKKIDTMVDGVTLNGKEDWQIWEENDLGIPLVLYNHLSYPVTRMLTLNREYHTVADDQGRIIPTQFVKGRYLDGAVSRGTLFEVKIPAYGYTTYWVYFRKETEKPADSSCIASGTALENDYIRAEFSEETGALVSLTDKRSGRELIASPSLVPELFKDASDTWSHQNVRGYPPADCERAVCEGVRVVENGPLLGRLRVKFRLKEVKAVIEYSLYKKDDYLDVQAKILYSEPQSYLKMPLYTSLKNTSAAFETPFGFIRKPASGCEQPALRFAAIEGDNGAAAFVCENKCSFSADGSKLSFVAVRNNVCANHFGTLTDDDYDYTDEGLHKFRFTVVPFGGKADCAKLTRIAECSGEPDYLLDTYHHGPLPRTASRIECRSENISVTACKRGEDGGVVLRAYETAQKPTDATIVYDGQKITAHFAPNSVHTFLLTEDGVKETDFIERIKQNP